MSRSRGFSSACLTARSVISLNVRRAIGRRALFSAPARCQAIASPSRSGSGARKMRSAFSAAARILASAALLPRIGTYWGSKSLSRSTPSSLFGRSMMWPFEASTENPRPRNLVSVRDLVGDSTITSDLPRPLPALFAPLGALPGSALRAEPLATTVLPAGFAGFAADAFTSGFAAAAAFFTGFLRAAPPFSVRELAITRSFLEGLGATGAAQGHAHRHLAREIHADGTNAARRQPVQHPLELDRVQRATLAQREQEAPRLGAQRFTLLGAQHALGRLARRLVHGRHRRPRRDPAPGEAAQRQHTGLDFLAAHAGFLEHLVQRFEGEVVALEPGFQMIRQQVEQLLDRVAPSLVAHVPLPTPWSISMWHFLYFLPLPHGHGSLRPTRGPLWTGAGRCPPASPAGRARGDSAPAPSPPAWAPAGSPPNPTASAWLSVVCCGRGRWRITCIASGASCTRNSAETKSSFTSSSRVSNSLNASRLYSTSGSRCP